MTKRPAPQRTGVWQGAKYSIERYGFVPVPEFEQMLKIYSKLK